MNDGETLSSAQLDRAAGTMLGLATGDALGAGYEFGTPPTGDAEMIGGGLGPWAPGEWTDDTQQAICIAEVAATGSLSPPTVGDRLLGWYREGQKDVGNQTRAVLSVARDGDDLSAVSATHLAAHPRNAAGNGSLMRTAPVALAHLGDDRAIVRAATDISALTHADPVAVEACVLWCIAIDRAVREQRLDGIHDGLALLDGEGRQRWEAWLHQAEEQAPESFKPNGYVVSALQAAWSAIMHTPVPSDQPCRHFQDALHAAVRIGDDTDTVAAIAGGLLGARWGATAVPLRWRTLLHGWPGLRAQDLVRLGILAARTGEDDDIGWPSAQDLRAQYLERWRVEPFAIALPDDPGVVLGNAASAVDATTDVMVSLCRMGRTSPKGVDEHHELIMMDKHDTGENPNLDFLLRDTADAIAGWRGEGRAVFVHCVAGISRTPTVAAAYLADRLGISGPEALERIRSVHFDANPNPAFLDALARF